MDSLATAVEREQNIGFAKGLSKPEQLIAALKQDLEQALQETETETQHEHQNAMGSEV